MRTLPVIAVLVVSPGMLYGGRNAIVLVFVLPQKRLLRYKARLGDSWDRVLRLRLRELEHYAAGIGRRGL